MAQIVARDTDSGLLIRDSLDADLPALQRIYAHHVLHGLASFEEQPPTLDEMARRRRELLRDGYPYLVGEADGQVIGYSYAGRYRPRPAYRHTVESTVYVADGQTRRGFGQALLGALIERCTAQGFRRMIAVIGDDAHLPSIKLHEALGFRLAGHLHAVGFKHGRWVDSVLMERALGAGDSTLPDG